MKTKNFKIVLPAFAILLAIGFAFATEANSINSPAFYNHPDLGAQPVPGGTDCPNIGTKPCLYGDYPVYTDISLETPIKRPD